MHSRFWQGSLRIITEFCQHQPELFNHGFLDPRRSRKKQENSCDNDHETNEHFFRRTIQGSVRLPAGNCFARSLADKRLGIRF